MRDPIRYFVVGFIVVKCSGFFISLAVLIGFSLLTGLNVISFINTIILWVLGKVFFKRKRRIY